MCGDVMAASKRFKTNYPGVFYRVSKLKSGRKGVGDTERVYYIVFKRRLVGNMLIR